MTCLGVVLAAANTLANEPATISSRRAGSALETAVVVPPRTFSRATVIGMCERFLLQHPTSALVRYVVFTDRQDGRGYLGGLHVTDVTFDGWRKAYLSEPTTVPATAELIRVGNCAAVRMRFRDGRVESQVLSACDPFCIRIRDRTAWLRWVSFHRSGAGPAPKPFYSVAMFVDTTSQWHLRDAEKLSEMLRRRAGSPWLEIVVEHGWWFAGMTGYPIYNRFLPRLPPPEVREYRSRGPTYYCDEPSGRCADVGPTGP